MFLSAFNGIKSAVLNLFDFPDVSSKCQFFLTLNKISSLFPELEEFF